MVRILLNLPVKDVIRSTLLHKSIYSLVHSKLFINTYNHRSLLYQINPPLIIFQLFTGPHDQRPRFLLRYNNAGLDEYMPPLFPFHDQLYPRSFLMGHCCNSLVCLFCLNEPLIPLILCNPYIQKTLTLPNPKLNLGNLRFFGLGFVSETSDYKLLIVDDTNHAELYSLQDNSWKIIAHPGPGTVVSVPQSSGWNNSVYLKGSLYWIGTISNKYVMGVFDFKDEVFSDISLSDGTFWDSLWKFSDSLPFLTLRVHTESSIAVIREMGSLFHIQVMDVDAKEWIKYSTVKSGSASFRVTNILGFNNERDEIVRWREFNVHNSEIKNRIGIHRNGKFIKVIGQAHHAEVSSNYVCNLELLDIAGESNQSAIIQRMLKEENVQLNI